MLSGDGNKKGQKKSVGLISTKTTLHMQHTFIVHFIAIVLHNYNAKLPDTSLLHVLLRKSFLYSCSLVSLLLIFTLVFASISHFLTAAKKFSCSSFDKIGLLFFFISHSSSFSVIHVNVDIKIKSKERIGFVVVIFFSLKVWMAMQFNDEMQGSLKCKISPRLT